MLSEKSKDIIAKDSYIPPAAQRPVIQQAKGLSQIRCINQYIYVSRIFIDEVPSPD